MSVSTCAPGPVIHNTSYCQVDSNGKILSQDQINARDENGGVHSTGGGCIARPIKDVWGIFFNNPLMQPSDVDEYTSTPRPDLVPPPSADPEVVFAFDIYNVHHVPLINPSWTVRWYHTIQFGTYEAPDEISINYQKIQGTSYITTMQGGYVLDRVTDEVTSWVSDEFVNATQYDTNKGTTEIQQDLVRMRTGAPMLPAAPMNPTDQ
jgi:hypothetical protein